ncbi:integrase arm-type DNA-binding domain-containing protein [Paucibacter sp. O1-1]|nr:integrase arm-type DNA-binding domain-containing protein [Paucibacter sp. O1-1]MDA3825175.1 integrase arm-type DNA-binding domain-containing protein [Paucibacter sp. O1-1]
MPLCDAQCRASKPAEKLLIRLLRSARPVFRSIDFQSSKLWRLQISVQWQKETRLSLGHYPAVSLQDARTHKDKIREQIKNGIDPVVSRIQEKLIRSLDNASTFELIAKEWHSKNVPAWNPRYAQTVQYRLDKYALPSIGRLPITQLKPPIILACIRKIEAHSPRNGEARKKHDQPHIQIRNRNWPG